MYNDFNAHNNNAATKFGTVKHLARRPPVLYYYNRRHCDIITFTYRRSERDQHSAAIDAVFYSLLYYIYCLHTTQIEICNEIKNLCACHRQ